MSDRFTIFSHLAWAAAAALPLAFAAPGRAQSPDSRGFVQVQPREGNGASSVSRDRHDAPPAPSATRPAAPADTRPPQLAAARADALRALHRDVLAAPLTPETSVGQFLTRVGETDRLLDRLRNAEQRGGTRWRNDQTCEVLLEIPGADVADVLSRVAADHPRDAGVTPEALQRGLNELRRKTFSAVGASVGAKDLTRLRPDDPTGPWCNVCDAERRDALTAAKANAVARVIESLRPVDMGSGKELNRALDVPEVANDVREWVASRPVTGVEFRDDLELRLTLSAPPEELWPVLQQSLIRNHLGPPTDDPAAWDRLRREVIREAAPAVGRSVATPDKDAARTKPAARVPRDPPRWVAQQIDVDGSAQGAGLKTARHAEADALAKLRAKIDALPLEGGTTLGDAARADPKVEQAVARAVRRAPTLKVDYGEKGTVKVRVTLVLEQLWRELADRR